MNELAQNEKLNLRRMERLGVFDPGTKQLNMTALRALSLSMHFVPGGAEAIVPYSRNGAIVPRRRETLAPVISAGPMAVMRSTAAALAPRHLGGDPTKGIIREFARKVRPPKRVSALAAGTDELLSAVLPFGAPLPRFISARRLAEMLVGRHGEYLFFKLTEGGSWVFVPPNTMIDLNDEAQLYRIGETTVNS